jgi:hypothetical protein
MQMFADKATAFVAKVFATDTVKMLGLIARDTVLVMSLLGALSVIHFGLRYTGATSGFLAVFTTVHEYFVLGTYVLLALKSLMHIAKI